MVSIFPALLLRRQLSDSVQIGGRHFDVDLATTLYDRMHRIDDLFISAAEFGGNNVVGIILTGRLSDGVAGLQAIKQAGGNLHGSTSG